MEALSRRIAESDAVVFGSPNFVSDVSGQFKTFIDRGHFVFEQLLHNEACATVVTYELFGSKSVQRVLENLVQRSGGAVVGRHRHKIDFSRNGFREKE